MKDTAPISLGIVAVAALFGLIAAGVAFVLYDMGFLGSAFMGVVVGGIAALALALGWREPNENPMGTAARVEKPAPTPAPAPAPTPAPAAAAPAPVAKEAPKPKATPKPKAAPKPKAEPAPAAASADGTPQFLSAAREGGPDDLKQIKGVGPKLEKTLHEMGIYHFDQIADWGPKEQAWMDDNLAGFKGRATRDEWVPQAKTLAAGGTTEFSKKVDKGGVY